MPRSRIGRPYLHSPICRYGRVLGRLQRVALRVDQVQAGLLAAHLAAEQQVDVEAEAVALERGAVDLRHPPDALADDPRGVVERARLRQPLAGVEVERAAAT